MALDNNWFTENYDAGGTAFSLRIKGKLHEEQSPFQHIAIYDTDTFGKLMVIDGCTMVSTRENFLYHEMMSHPVLYTHPDPQRVVIIGGGDCGTLQQVLRHAEVKQAWQIEIDERVTRLAEEYFPELCADNSDPRATLLFDDGIQWIKDAADESLDVIIIDSTDPVGPAEGLFTEPFYKECHRALRAHGLIIQQSESPLLHMHILKSMHKEFRGAGFQDVKTLQFPQPIYPSGWWSATLGCKDGNIEGFREQAVAARGFKTKYYSAAIHLNSFAMPVFFLEQIGQ